MNFDFYIPGFFSQNNVFADVSDDFIDIDFEEFNYIKRELSLGSFDILFNSLENYVSKEYNIFNILRKYLLFLYLKKINSYQEVITNLKMFF